MAKKIFNPERIMDQLSAKLIGIESFNERVRCAVKFEDSLIEKGIIDSYNDKREYLAIASEAVEVPIRTYSSAEYVERHGNRNEKNSYTQETAFSIGKKIRSRESEQLKITHPELVRTCKGCGKTKHLSEFYNNGFYERSGNIVNFCKECDAEKERARNKKKVQKRAEKRQQKMLNEPVVTQIKNADDQNQDITKYAVSEIISNIRLKKQEINDLFFGWNDTLKTVGKQDRELIGIEMDALIKVAKSIKKGI